jgi:predicted transcriptional regulator
MADLTLHLDDKMLERLQSEAKQRNVPLEALVSEALEFYFDDDDEPTKEEILEDIRQGMIDALTGNVRPAHEVLDEIERKVRENANES